MAFLERVSKREGQDSFSKMGEVKDFEDVLKSRMPKDTEITQAWSHGFLIRSPDCSVGFGQKYRRKEL